MSEKQSIIKRIFRFCLPVFFVVIGFVIFKALVSSKPRARKSNSKSEARLVEVISLEKKSERIRIKGNGLVIPAQKLELKAQVRGEVNWHNSNMMPGGLLKKDELLFKLQDIDYKLALSQKEALFAQAELAFELEKARGSVAAKEWSFASKVKGVSDKKKRLILREPYLKVAEANYKSALSGLEKAKLDLSRTRIKAPFNALVQAENIEIGQVVTGQMPAAVLIGTDRFFIQVSVPYSDLKWIEFPESGMAGSEVIIKQLNAGKSIIERKGRVVRLIGELDKVGRMARLLVEVKDPLSLLERNSEKLPLLLGSYVDVEILASKDSEFYALPRLYLRNSNQLWIYSENSTLEVKEISISWSDRKNVYFKDQIKGLDKVIKTRILVPIPGMKLTLSQSSPNPKNKKPKTAQVK